MSLRSEPITCEGVSRRDRRSCSRLLREFISLEQDLPVTVDQRIAGWLCPAGLGRRAVLMSTGVNASLSLPTVLRLWAYSYKDFVLVGPESRL